MRTLILAVLVLAACDTDTTDTSPLVGPAPCISARERVLAMVDADPTCLDTWTLRPRFMAYCERPEAAQVDWSKCVAAMDAIGCHDDEALEGAVDTCGETYTAVLD